MDGRAPEPSLAAFIGLGDKSTNPGINNKVNNAAGTGRVANFTPTPPVTPIISSGFGFGTATSATAPTAAANKTVHLYSLPFDCNQASLIFQCRHPVERAHPRTNKGQCQSFPF